MERRDFIKAAGGVAMMGAAGNALAQGAAMDHAHMAGMDHEHMHMGAAPDTHVQALALDCVKAGELCLNHCLDSYAMGDLSMAGCARTVDQMLAVCAALAKLASVGSPHLMAMAHVAHRVCADCERECRKHAAEHEVCRACAEACKACGEACMALMG